MLLTDLRELKTYLEIDPDDSSQDKILNYLNEIASEWIISWLDRPSFDYKLRTEYYDGKNTTKLLLKARPAYYDATHPITVITDGAGGYGSISGSFTGTPLTYGMDYFLKIDDESGYKSRSAILIRNNAYWQKNYARSYGLLTPFLVTANGTIQVTYYGGFTIDDMPSQFRWAVNTLIARMRFILPTGFPVSGDSYAEKSISIISPAKDYLMGLILPQLRQYRSWHFGV